MSLTCHKIPNPNNIKQTHILIKYLEDKNLQHLSISNLHTSSRLQCKQAQILFVFELVRHSHSNQKRNCQVFIDKVAF